MTEKEMREAKVIWPKTEKALLNYVRKLAKENDEYGKAVYAMSMATTAMFYYMSHVLGVTGFQASCADLDFLGRVRHLEGGFRIVKYDDLLYPQYLNEEHFPSPEYLINKQSEMLKKKAKVLLMDKSNANPEVIKHWEYLANLPDKEAHND